MANYVPDPNPQPQQQQQLERYFDFYLNRDITIAGGGATSVLTINDAAQLISIRPIRVPRIRKYSIPEEVYEIKSTLAPASELSLSSLLRTIITGSVITRDTLELYCYYIQEALIEPLTHVHITESGLMKWELNDRVSTLTRRERIILSALATTISTVLHRLPSGEEVISYALQQLELVMNQPAPEFAALGIIEDTIVNNVATRVGNTDVSNWIMTTNPWTFLTNEQSPFSLVNALELLSSMMLLLSGMLPTAVPHEPPLGEGELKYRLAPNFTEPFEFEGKLFNNRTIGCLEISAIQSCLWYNILRVWYELEPDTDDEDEGA